MFSKHLPNVKLASRYDAEGREIQVERREDIDATVKEQATFDLLVTAGYFRARIKGLSSFDKVVGGMAWCIECSDYDVDVDLLFHENLTIGLKIALVEKIVSVLPQMKCPFLIEPHQIQGLEFLSIHPVIQWLVKKSVENRAERSARLKRFAIGQFHNHYQYKTDKDNLDKIRRASAHIKRIQELYAPSRQYQCKDLTNEHERTRVRMTLLEYGNKAAAANISASEVPQSSERNHEQEIQKLFENLSLAKENIVAGTTKPLNAEQRDALHQHYAEIKQEMETDAKQLSEQSQLKILKATKIALERKLEQNHNEVTALQAEVAKQQAQVEHEAKAHRQLQAEVAEYKSNESKADAALLVRVQELLKQHDELKKQEAEFKEQCRQDLAALQKEIDELEIFNEQNPKEQAAALAVEKERIQQLKLQVARKNRGIVAIERQLDAVPDRTELTQYQSRFHELHNEMSAKHLETKQYFALFNTLNDKKRYLEKELSLLNSICEAYNECMSSAQGREEFIEQFEAIVAGVKKTEAKVRKKYNEEHEKRDALNVDFQALLELQRQYAAAVKQLTRECQRCDQLQQHLKSIRREK